MLVTCGRCRARVHGTLNSFSHARQNIVLALAFVERLTMNSDIGSQDEGFEGRMFPDSSQIIHLVVAIPFNCY